MTENKNVTPYEAAKLVNIYLALEGIEKTIPPQMMYNYTKQRVNKGVKPFIKFDEKTGVDVKDLERWTKAYAAKLTNKVVEETVAS